MTLEKEESTKELDVFGTTFLQRHTAIKHSQDSSLQYHVPSFKDRDNMNNLHSFSKTLTSKPAKKKKENVCLPQRHSMINRTVF